MSSRSSQPPRPHRVIALVDDRSNAFELAYAAQILTSPVLDGPAYTFGLCAFDPSSVPARGPLGLTAIEDLDALEDADTVFAPNRADPDAPPGPSLVAALRRAHARGARLAACWSGAFALADAGLLDGRTATTHWQWAARFRARYPRVHYRDGVLFVDDGDVLTGAGGATAIDLTLHLVRRDLGVTAAADVAEALLLPATRDGAERQRSVRPTGGDRSDSLAPVLGWLRSRLDEPVTVAAMAAAAGVSPATLHRRFRAQTGRSPLAWLTSERLQVARALLEGGEPSVDLVARRSGLGSAANLRSLLHRATGLTPTAYRRRFSPNAAPTPDR